MRNEPAVGELFRGFLGAGLRPSFEGLCEKHTMLVISLPRTGILRYTHPVLSRPGNEVMMRDCRRIRMYTGVMSFCAYAVFAASCCVMQSTYDAALQEGMSVKRKMRTAMV